MLSQLKHKRFFLFFVNRNPHIPAKKHVIEKIEINNAVFLLNHMLSNCITVGFGKIVLKCKYRVRIDQLFDRKSFIGHVLGKSTGTTQ